MRPLNFLDGRLSDRFWSKVQPCPMSGCWLFVGASNRTGYGYMRVGGVGVLAHRLAYESLVGPIGDGLHIDHVCRQRCCVNPAHLEPVTQQENIRRGEAGLNSGRQQRRRTHCIKGHEFTDANTKLVTQGNGNEYRACIACRRAYDVKYYWRDRPDAAG